MNFYSDIFDVVAARLDALRSSGISERAAGAAELMLLCWPPISMSSHDVLSRSISSDSKYPQRSGCNTCLLSVDNSLQ
jgi:hypothetical protein